MDPSENRLTGERAAYFAFSNFPIALLSPVAVEPPVGLRFAWLPPEPLLTARFPKPA